MNKKLPFLDSAGNEIYEGSIIHQINFNGEEYTATYKVVKDFDGGSDDTFGFCLEMLSGNEKAMKTSGLSSFGNIVNGLLKKGVVEI